MFRNSMRKDKKRKVCEEVGENFPEIWKRYERKAKFCETQKLVSL